MAQTFTTISSLRTALRVHDSVGFVPTMGFLHEGHLGLVRQAKQVCDVVVVSVFINPTQFSQNEDLSTYPSDIEGDLDKLNSVGATYVFLPQKTTCTQKTL
eukprot:JP446317.1.p2 GENE.JP446317.1~~JP446317.1.p2  ORF type:complete len:101 (+),score=7.80 JP446317.1:72-374(+)